MLTGRGKAFSAGMDLEAAQSGLPTDPVWERLSGALTALPCLTIAALNGTVAGGAMGMVLACDLRAVNHRYLDLAVRLPDELRSLEPAVRERVAAAVSRGKVDLVLRLRNAATTSDLRINRTRWLCLADANSDVDPAGTE